MDDCGNVACLLPDVGTDSFYDMPRSQAMSKKQWFVDSKAFGIGTQVLASLTFECYGSDSIPYAAVRSQIEHCDTALFPESVIPLVVADDDSGVPVIFRFVNRTTGKSYYCRMLASPFNDNRVYLPQWMMRACDIREGEPVAFHSVKIPYGSVATIRLDPSSSSLSVDTIVKALGDILSEYSVVFSGERVVRALPNGDIMAFTIDRVLPSTDSGAAMIVGVKLAINFVSGDVTSTTPTNGTTTVTAMKQPSQKSIKIVGSVLSDSERKTIETVTCSNCGSIIAKDNITMHELRCSAINSRCTLCSAIIQKGKEDQHYAQWHTSTKCVCGDVVENGQMAVHEQSQCKMRQKRCLYCRGYFTVLEYPKHEQECGAVQERCKLCNQHYPRRDASAHCIGKCT